MTRSYEVKYRDILNREMTLYFHIDDSPSMLDRPRLKKLIPERFKGLIDYPCTIPWQCFMTHDGCAALDAPMCYLTGEFEQSEPIRSALKDPYKDGVAFHAALRRKGLPEEWWNGFRDSMNHDDEAEFYKEMDAEIKADQAAGIAYDQEHRPWGDTLDG